MEYEINDRQRVFLSGHMYRKQLREIRFSGNSVLIGMEAYPASDWYRNALIVEFIKRMIKIKERINKNNHLWMDYFLEHKNLKNAVGFIRRTIPGTFCHYKKDEIL